MFLLKIVHKDKNTIKNTKSQPKKTVCETVNFGSTEWYITLLLMICYENVVKNVVNVALLFSQYLIFSCD